MADGSAPLAPASERRTDAALLRLLGNGFGMAVEAELRASVFEPFVQDIRAESVRFATEEKDGPLHGLARYLTRDQRIQLTLGLMVGCLTATETSTHPLAQRLHGWLEAERPGLAKHVKQMGTDLPNIAKLRNKATHPSGPFGPREAELLYSRAHALLNASAWR
jgi:hypothetical protein